MNANDHPAGAGSPRRASVSPQSAKGGISFADLLSRLPKVHAGRSITWAIHPQLARFLDDHLRMSHVTLETGSGLSTLVILRKGVARHIAVAPDPDEFVVLREFCEQHGIPLTPLEAVAKKSEEYLPIAPLPALDLVLVDGLHAFPSPFVDWYYTADRLVVGGLMVVDDIQLVTGRLLTDFMDADPKWERVLYDRSRFGIYRKLQHPIHAGDWMDQPYVADTNPVGDVTITRMQPEYRHEPGHSERALVAVYARLPASAQRLYRALRQLVRGDQRRA